MRVLTNFTLIDGRGGPAAPNSALIITDGRISCVGPAAQMKAPAGAVTENLAGRFVMPGLINLHSHVAESDGVVQDPVKFFTRQEVERDLRLYASYGVTSVASLGTDQPLVYTIRDEQRRGRPAMARIFTAGRGFTVKDGFPTNKGNVPGVPYEPTQASDVPPQMNELAARRPDVVKIWVDDRFGDFKKTPIEISRPIIEGAHKHKVKVIAHIFYLDDAKQLAAAGLDAFGHSVRDKAVDNELISLMKKHGTWLIPTLVQGGCHVCVCGAGSLPEGSIFYARCRAAHAGGAQVAGYPEGADRRQVFSELPALFEDGAGQSQAACGCGGEPRVRLRHRRADAVRGLRRTLGAGADGAVRADAHAGDHRGDQTLRRISRSARSRHPRARQMGRHDSAVGRSARRHQEHAKD